MTVIRAKLFSLVTMAFLFVVSASADHLDLIGSVGWNQSRRGIQIRAEEVANTAASGVSGFLRLRIWATDEPDDGMGELTGYVIGTLNLGRLEAGFSFFDVSRVVRFFPPPPGIYYTTITLEEEQFDGSFLIVDSENFAGAVNFGGYGAGIVEDLESAGDVTFVGDVWWESGNGRVEIFAERIQNERLSGKSGTLRLRLWATTTPYSGGTLQGWPLAKKRVGRVTAGFYVEFLGSGFFRPPPPDDEYYVTLTLEEFVRRRWEIVDYITFPGTSLF